MQYRVNPKNGDEISALGFGCMRFHRDENEVARQICNAVEQGVNYFDTAYVYPGSETRLGRVLQKNNLRGRVNLATKLPHYLVKKREDIDKTFSTQLERLQTDHIDYYLLHMLTDVSNWCRMRDIGMEDWIAEKKKTGQIRNIGFSFHGVQAEFMGLLEEYDWDFCMVQYNYYDEFNQAGKAGLKRAGEKGIPVMVMEPLRGGTLVSKLPPGAAAVFENAPLKRSPADWGLRWVLNHPQVLCVLSGMGTQAMVEENIKTASEAKAGALTGEELALYARVREKMNEATKVPCTGCGYCMPCPQGVDIPMCFASLNDTVIRGRFTSMYWYALTTREHSASGCIQCGKCETHCPQSIPIREKLAQVQRELEGFPYKPIRFAVQKLISRR